MSEGLKLIVSVDGKKIESFDLTEGKEFILGASPQSDCPLSSEPFLSRHHLTLRCAGGKLKVTKLKKARNPVLFKGNPSDQFVMGSGMFFVIGSTRFTFEHGGDDLNKGKTTSLESAPPIYQFTLDSDQLRPKQNRSDRLRLLDLMELPEILRTKSRADFYVYACGLLRLTAGAQWARVLTSEEGKHTLLAEDASVDRAMERPMSQVLIDSALTEAPHPVTHCWSHPLESIAEATAHEGIDWAVCCAMPVPGEIPILLYIAGTTDAVGEYLGFDTQSGAQTFLRDTARLVGLVADMISRAMALQKVEGWQSRLGRFFSGKLVTKILEAEGTDELKPKIAEATIMFFDIRGFSLLTEGNLERILEYECDLKRVLTAMTQSIYDHEGVVLRYMGDGILACWNVPYEVEGHVGYAGLAALDMVDKMAEVTEGWACGIGMGVGDVVAGSLGSEQIYAYDVLGAVANQAARVEGITKIVGVPILVTDEAAKRLPVDKILTRRVARFRPAGMDLEVDLHTIDRAPADQAEREAIEKKLAIHAEGLAAFESGQWEKAFEVLHPIVQDDAAARYVYKLALQGKPPRGWNGVVELSGK